MKRNRYDVDDSCYCDLWETDPDVLQARDVPRGYCGICQVCGEPGHTRHYPGPVPVTGAWCNDCYERVPAIPLMMKLLNALYALVILAIIGLLLWWLL
ncbi:MAG: hypothetical protein ACYS15_11040 [Planctomycetota bacterium]|jgi:hypothetical protein